jgi:hypothetical protein
MTGSVAAAANTRAIGFGGAVASELPGSAPPASISTDEWNHGAISRSQAAS